MSESVSSIFWDLVVRLSPFKARKAVPVKRGPEEPPAHLEFEATPVSSTDVEPQLAALEA